MAFIPKPTKNKNKMCYKSLYISEQLTERLNKIAEDNDTSFNNVVISILEDFFEKEE